jgi:hypothetical protein
MTAHDTYGKALHEILKAQQEGKIDAAQIKQHLALAKLNFDNDRMMEQVSDPRFRARMQATVRTDAYWALNDAGDVVRREVQGFASAHKRPDWQWAVDLTARQDDAWPPPPNYYEGRGYKAYGEPRFDHWVTKDRRWIDLRDPTPETIERSAKQIGISTEALMYKLWPNWVPPSKPLTKEQRREILRPWPEGLREAERMAQAWRVMEGEREQEGAASLLVGEVTAMFE